MNALDALTGSIRQRGDKALVPFLTAGYPDEDTFIRLLDAVAEAGCPLVEIGIPFSDPVADGPVIQAASQQALMGGMNLKKVLALAAGARQRSGLTVVLMGYLNPILKYGPERFAGACTEAGIAGLIVPDLPHEEATGLRNLLAEQQVSLVELVAPTTDEDRLRQIVASAQGFLYLVSATGVTGAGGGIDVGDYVQRVRRTCDLPLYVGFGISSAEVAAEVCRDADGIIIGSALLKIVAESADTGTAVRAVGSFLEKINVALAEVEGSRS